MQDLPINEFVREKIDASVNELAEEREMVSDHCLADFNLTSVPRSLRFKLVYINKYTK